MTPAYSNPYSLRKKTPTNSSPRSPSTSTCKPPPDPLRLQFFLADDGGRTPPAVVCFLYLVIPQRDHRINPRSPARRKISSQRRHSSQQNHHRHKRNRIRRR